ncbi:hypothetical protein ACWEOW_11310 [Monashia sp. NPDC004114]
MSIRKLTDKQARELVVDTEPWLSCDDCFRLMDEYVELLVADPASTAMPQMQVHLRACPACAEEAESLVALVREDR